MSHGFFDEKAVIALAFFFCVGLIVKFFGKNFVGFLSAKQKEICDEIYKNENQFDTLENTIIDLKKQEEAILNRNKSIDLETEKEKNFIIENANSKAQELLTHSVETQKAINKKITEETLQNFSKIPFKVARDTITMQLSSGENAKLHENLIDNALDEFLDGNFETSVEKDEKSVKKKLNVLLIGSGGREYALAWRISESAIINKLFSINGSDGIGKFAELHDVEWKNFDKVLDLCKEKKIDLVVIGPEEPLVNGLSDFLHENNILVFGPSMNGAKIEASKEFTKTLCDKKNIPTAKYEVFTDLTSLQNHLNGLQKFPVVLKYDGLAGGKGVKVCKNLEEASDYADILHTNYKNAFKVVVEEFLEGRELSFFAVTDGNIVKKFAFAQDYKCAFDNDEGENTGGMGAISGNFLINSELEVKIMTKIINPTIDFLRENKIDYKGILFAGLMIDENDEPYLLEFNARFGDPETEAIMMRLNSDLLELLFSVARGKLSNTDIDISEQTSLCVVLASNGYPSEYKKDILISDNLPKDEKDCKIFHHGTYLSNKKWHSNGGRVLSVNVLGENIKKIRTKAYKILEKIKWNDGFYRKDIGKKYE